MRARLAAAGIHPGSPDLDGALVLDIVYQLITELWPHDTNRHRLLTELDDNLTRPPWPVRELWGTGVAAVAGQRAMMAMAGGPAPMRTTTPAPEAAPT